MSCLLWHTQAANLRREFRDATPKPRVVAVVGWQRNFGRMLRAFDARLPPGSKIFILSEKEVWFRRKDLATEGLAEYGGAIQVESFLRFKPATKKGGQQRRSTSSPLPSQGVAHGPDPDVRMGPIPGCTGLVNCTLHHRVGIVTDEIALRRVRA